MMSLTTDRSDYRVWPLLNYKKNIATIKSMKVTSYFSVSYLCNVNVNRDLRKKIGEYDVDNILITWSHHRGEI